MSETALSLAPSSIDPSAFFKPEQVALIKRQIAKNVTDDELKLFLYQCARTGLDPFSRQIYALSRREKRDDGSWGEKMSIQTGIDGLRLIADRTGRYAPGADNDYEYDAAGSLRRATAHVLKRTGDGTWHTISASAFFSEYVQMGKEGPTRMWKEKPHIMLGKCAEALALRKAFPAEMSGIYTSDEMGQTEVAPIVAPLVTEVMSSTPAPAATRLAAAPSLTVVPSSGPGDSAGAAAVEPAAADTGEAPTEDDLDALSDLAFKELKLKKPYFANWAKKYYKGLPDSWTRQQLTDAMSTLMAMGLGPEQYRAKLAALHAAGRIAAGPEAEQP